MDQMICQSCGFSFTEENKGTNRDLSLNEEYCNRCYKEGDFQDKSLSLRHLEAKILEMARIHCDITLEEARLVIKKLPHLKRWQFHNI